MDEISNTPAGRLHYVLTKLSQANGTEQSRKAWAKILEVDPQDRSRLLRKMGHVHRLPSQVKAAIESHAILNDPSFLSWTGAVESVFSQMNLEGHIGQTTQRYTNASTDVLLTVDSILKKSDPDIEVDTDALKILQEDIVELNKHCWTFVT